MSRNLMFAILVVIATLTGCAKPTVDQGLPATKESSEKVASSEAKNQSIEVDKGILNVDVKLPASMFKGANIDEVIAKAKEDGVSEVTKNEDGSLTYKMSKLTHSKFVKKMEGAVLEYVEGIKSNKDFKSIKDVTYNKSFSEFTLSVDQKAYKNSFDGIANLGLYLTSGFYQLFQGADPNTYKTTIILKDADTGEVFNTVIYPDVLKKSAQ